MKKIWLTAYGFGKGLRVKCVGDNESGVFEINEDSDPREMRNSAGISISRAGGLLIPCNGDLILVLSVN